MTRFLQLLLALIFLGFGLWLLYAGYGREVSLAGKTETGLTYFKTGLDGKTRVMTHHWHYGAGLLLIIGSIWWLAKGGGSKQVTGRRRR